MGICKKRLWLYLICLVLVNNNYAKTIQETRNWNTLILRAPFDCHNKWRIYLQPGLNFTDNSYKFHTSFIYAGVGYTLNDQLTLWLLNGWFVTRGIQTGEYRHRDTLREQLDWSIFHNNTIELTSNIRFEQRKDYSETGIALRLRDRLTIRAPIQCWNKHNIVVFDEAYFNLNHPTWTNSNSFLDVNLFFVGLGTEINKYITIEVGYMHQYQIRTPEDRSSNILHTRFLVTY